MEPTNAKHPETGFVDRTAEAAIRIGILGLVIGLCYWIVEPFLVPLIWGVIIAVAGFPGYRRLVGLLGGRSGLAAVAFGLIALIVLIVPILMLSGTLIEGAESMVKGFQSGQWAVPPPPDLSHIPLIGEPVESIWSTATTNITEALVSLEPQLKVAGRWVLKFATEAGIGLVHFALAIGIAAFLLAHSSSAHRTAHHFARRLAGTRGSEFADLSESVVRSVTRGILGVALIQSLLAGIGMLVAGIPAAGLWALVALLLTTVQLGVLPVMLPAAIYVFFHSGLFATIVFVAWSLMVGSLEHVLKPILLGIGVRVPMAVIFVGAIGGFLEAGIIGLFVGAVILALGYELFMAWLSGDASRNIDAETTEEGAGSSAPSQQ